MRYTAVAIILHWTIAAVIVLNLIVGFWMGEAIEDPLLKSRAIAAFQLHKSLGLTVLVLSLLRLAWRLMNAPPALPAGMKAWEILAARFTHWAFYALMIAVPLSGWLMVSAQWDEDHPLNVPTLWFGLFPVPHLFHLNEAADATRQWVSESAGETHELLAFATCGLLGLHVAAALQHQFIKRDRLFARMQPGLGAALALGLIAAGAVWGIARMNAAMLASPAGRPSQVRSAAGGWWVDAASTIEFSGTEEGTPFNGRFTRWQADIRFDAAHPEASTITATVDTASATDGVVLHDETLRQAEWFDVARYPDAEYRATRVVATAPGHYAIEGTLRIKDRSLPVTGLSAVVENGVLHLTGKFEVDRKDAGLGLATDAEGSLVSRRIVVAIRVDASHQRP